MSCKKRNEILETKKISDSLKLLSVGVINHFIISEKILFEAGTTCSAGKLLKKGYKNKIKTVIISHGHFDHITGAKVIGKGITLFAHEGILKLLQKEKVTRNWEMEDEEFCINQQNESKKSDNFKNLNFRDIDEFQEDNLEIIRTPGHSPDSICIFNSEESYALVSDSFGFPLRSGSINIPMFFSGFNEYIKSIEKIKDLEPKIICTGHNGFVADLNYCDVAIESAYNLSKEIEDGLKEQELFNRIYRDELMCYPKSTIEVVAKILIKRVIED